MGAKGTFVTIKDNVDGIGKLIAAEAEYAEVEFFDSPSGPRLVNVRVRLSSVERVTLSRQTRIFMFEPDSGIWRAGRIDELITDEQSGNEEHYSVKFPNGLSERVPVSRLFVRWSRPIDDPTEYLAATRGSAGDGYGDRRRKAMGRSKVEKADGRRRYNGAIHAAG